MFVRGDGTIFPSGWINTAFFDVEDTMKSTLGYIIYISDGPIIGKNVLAVQGQSLVGDPKVLLMKNSTAAR
jgi:hypothetical protein